MSKLIQALIFTGGCVPFLLALLLTPPTATQAKEENWKPISVEDPDFKAALDKASPIIIPDLLAAGKIHTACFINHTFGIATDSVMFSGSTPGNGSYRLSFAVHGMRMKGCNDDRVNLLGGKARILGTGRTVFVGSGCMAEFQVGVASPQAPPPVSIQYAFCSAYRNHTWGLLSG